MFSVTRHLSKNMRGGRLTATVNYPIVLTKGELMGEVERAVVVWLTETKGTRNGTSETHYILISLKIQT